MTKYVSVPVRPEVFEELRRLKEGGGFRSYTELLRHLISLYKLHRLGGE